MKNNAIPVSEKIAAYFNNLYGPEWTENYCRYAESENTQFIRINTLKAENTGLAERLKSQYGITITPVKDIPELYSVDDPDRMVGKTIDHITGKYYIQSLSSIMPVLALNPEPGCRVLDLCAAPGSKTTAIAARMNNTGIVVANEIQANRTGILNFNIERLSILNTGIVNMPGEWLSPRFNEYFDSALTDVPCSGLGIVHKKGEVSNWWNEDLIQKLSMQQYKLLHAAAKMVKPGGTIIYSTCTLSVEENEMVINKIISKLPLELEEFELPVITEHGFTSYGEEKFDASLALTKRIIPWHNNSEGFFVAKLRKTGSIPNDSTPFKKHRAVCGPVKSAVMKKIAEKLEEEFGIPAADVAGRYIVEKSNDFYLLSNDWKGENLEDFNKIGMKIGTFDRYGNFIAHTNLIQIFANIISKNILNITEPEQIRKYLDGVNLKADFGGMKGQVAVAYKGVLLGSGVINQESLKSRFPRNFRTQAIEL